MVKIMKKQIWTENGHYVATRKFLANAKYFGTPEYYELRAAMADNPDFKVGTLSVSPRGDLMMPSDACVRIWMDELEQL